MGYLATVGVGILFVLVSWYFNRKKRVGAETQAMLAAWSDARQQRLLWKELHGSLCSLTEAESDEYDMLWDEELLLERVCLQRTKDGRPGISTKEYMAEQEENAQHQT